MSNQPPADGAKLREQLAAIEHERWASWQKWMHGTFLIRSDGRMKYRTILPTRLVDRWERQIATPYADLSEAEKQSDRDQVDRYWPLIEAYLSNRLQEFAGKVRAEVIGNDGDIHDRESPSWTEMRYDAAQLGMNTLRANQRQALSQLLQQQTKGNGE